MSHELNKAEKKIARQLIDKGFDIECKTVLDQAAEILSEWKQNGLNNTTAYHKLFIQLQKHDKLIRYRYTEIKGSRYLSIVRAIYEDGQITEDDIKDFSENTRSILNKWKQHPKD